MSLQQENVQDRIEELANELNISEEQAFVRLINYYLSDQSVYDFSPFDFVDGGQDKMLDSISYIEEANGDTSIYIIRARNIGSFQPGSLVRFKDGLSWIFDKPKAELGKLKNQKLHDKIDEFRSLYREKGPSMLNVVVAFVTNGILSSRSEEFRQEEKLVEHELEKHGFGRFELVIWGSDEIGRQISQREGHPKIDADIRILHDVNTASFIHYQAKGLKGMICTVAAVEIAQLVINDKIGAVFDLNLRRYLGNQSNVNKDIFRTCSDADDADFFWFMNNGITIVCDSFEFIKDPDDAHVRLKGMQIVNGCQTASALAEASKKKSLNSSVQVLLRIYQAPSIELISKIVLTTNSQNTISSRDLRANDSVQVDMERAFAQYGYYYERKPSPRISKQVQKGTKVISNEYVAKCYMAIVLAHPSVGYARKAKIWDEDYRKVFSPDLIEPYIIAYLIHERVGGWLAKSGYTSTGNTTKRKLAKSGSFHVARIASYLLMKGNKFDIPREQLKVFVSELQDEQNILDGVFEKAFNLLHEIIMNERQYVEDVDRALKNGPFDFEIERTLKKISF
jgi:hypothetical protein